MRSSRTFMLLSALALWLLGACSAGHDPASDPNPAVNAPVSSSSDCTDNCRLTKADVEAVIGRAVAEADAQGAKATIAVVDRVGNVLGVFKMTGANDYVTISSTVDSGVAVAGGLEGLNFVPATLAAIAKAVTAAYLSTSGDAFSTRTASQIIQDHFNPGEQNTPSGPLFGVQFSQLPCSDFSTRYDGSGTSSVGPHRSPLGLSADPGGLPLYINGHAVGGVGVMSDGYYSLDKNVFDFDQSMDEIIATAGMQGYAPPVAIRADRITLAGKTGKFDNASAADLMSKPGDAQDLATLAAAGEGSLVAVPGYAAAQVIDGTVFGQPDSGIRAADPSVFKDQDGNSLDAFVFVNAANVNRFPAQDAADAPGGSSANALTANEVQTLLNAAIGVANESRAQIRVPQGSPARVTVSVVDTEGHILGMARSRDGPVFGADVSLQKARTAAFFSSTGTPGYSAADQLRALPDPKYLAALPAPVDPAAGLTVLTNPAPRFSNYLRDVQNFIGVPDALESFGPPAAFSDRAGGNLSRPRFPDGPLDGPPGPLSKPPGQWSVFSTGFQSDLSYNAIIHHIGFVLGLVPDVGQDCTGDTGDSATAPFSTINSIPNIANGTQIFPGSVPIYRGDVRIGAIGVSGDGVDQDDMISFLGVYRAGVQLDDGLHNAPPEIRADQIDIPNQQARLRFVNCPQVPFIDSNKTGVCDGI